MTVGPIAHRKVADLRSAYSYSRHLLARSFARASVLVGVLSVSVSPAARLDTTKQESLRGARNLVDLGMAASGLAVLGLIALGLVVLCFDLDLVVLTTSRPEDV